MIKTHKLLNSSLLNKISYNYLDQNKRIRKYKGVKDMHQKK